MTLEEIRRWRRILNGCYLLLFVWFGLWWSILEDSVLGLLASGSGMSITIFLGDYVEILLKRWLESISQR